MRYTGNGTGIFKNNIVQVSVGTLLSVATSSQAGFVSDYNLLYPGSGAANVGLWGGTPATTLAAWQALTVRDTNSVSADPQFLDIDGADNVLGEQGVPEGNGADDNFHLRGGSPAIDRGDTWNASPTDAEGGAARDAAGANNAGSRCIVENSLGANQFAATGVAKTGGLLMRSFR